jgi:phosphatidate cytidylyltransferase
MSDLHSLNEAINKRAGRKLLPSIGVSVFLVLIVWGSLYKYPVIFVALVTIAVVLGIREIVKAFAATGTNLSMWALSLASIGLSSAAWFGGVSGLAVATAIAFPALLILLLPQGPDGFVKRATATTLSLIYLPFLAGFLVLLANPYDGKNGLQRVMTLVVLVGCNDTFAYLTGVLFGKHKLAPSISPKKSIEGLVGGVAVAAVASALVAVLLLDASPLWGIFWGALTAVAAEGGDLLESMIKRAARAENASTLIPGHGGVLDRIDSLLLALPVALIASFTLGG